MNLNCRQCSQSPFRLCSENPFNSFGRLFGCSAVEEHQELQGARGDGGTGTRRNVGAQPALGPPLNEAEIRDRVNEWSFYVHHRALDFFEGWPGLEAVLRDIARNVPRGYDPVCNTADGPPVLWMGRLEDGEAVMTLTKPKEGQSQVWVNRVLAFIFVEQEGFDRLMRLAKRPFTTKDGNKINVNIWHITQEVRVLPRSTLSTIMLESMEPAEPVDNASAINGVIGAQKLTISKEGKRLPAVEVESRATSVWAARLAIAHKLQVVPQTVALVSKSGVPLSRDEVTLNSLSF